MYLFGQCLQLSQMDFPLKAYNVSTMAQRNISNNQEGLSEITTKGC